MLAMIFLDNVHLLNTVFMTYEESSPLPPLFLFLFMYCLFYIGHHTLICTNNLKFTYALTYLSKRQQKKNQTYAWF